MLISLEWLRRYVTVDVTPGKLAERLTMTGFPVVAAERLEPAPGRDREDVQLDVEITSNRPDLQCHLGVAREIAGLVGSTARRPEIPTLPLTNEMFEVAVDAPDLCPLYTARVIRGVQVGPSPDWLVRLLEAAGQRSINNVVDITNFVLLESGHPLHAFDLAKLRGSRLVARRAAGESFTSIDGTELEVGKDELVIADAEVPVALAGVMGGLDSEVSDGTTDIVLECAVFDPLAIRHASRAHQLRSESSFRFERFVDVHAADWASDRAAALMVELGGATGVGPICRAGPAVGRVEARAVSLRTAQIERVLGIAVSEDEICEALTGLGLEQIDQDDDDGDGVTGWGVPSWRLHDLHEEIDLIEEVARRIGFDRIPDDVRIPVRPLPKTPQRDAIVHLRDTLAAAGLRECCTEPFVGEGALDVALLSDAPALRVENPMRHDESLLRRSLVGTLLRVVRGNASRGVHGVRFFEIAPVYLRGGEDGDEPDERLLVTVALTGGFADVIGVLDAATAALGLRSRVSIEKGAPSFLARDRAATVRLDGAVLGHVGELAPRSRRAFGIDADVAVLELRADVLASRAELLRDYEPVSRFPAVERDLAFVLAEDVTWGALEEVVRDAAGALLADVAPFDVYRGTQLGDGRKSIGLRMELRSHERTLTGEQADAVVAAVVSAVSEHVGGELRA